MAHPVSDTRSLEEVSIAAGGGNSDKQSEGMPELALASSSLNPIASIRMAPYTPRDRAVFGVPLQDSLAIAQIDGIPAVVFRCIQFLEASLLGREDNPSDEDGGKGPSSVRLQEMFDAKGDIDLLVSQTFLDPFEVILLLRRFIQFLPDRIESILFPQITSKLNAIAQITPQMLYLPNEDVIYDIHQLISMLPRYYLPLLRTIYRHNKETFRNLEHNSSFWNAANSPDSVCGIPSTMGIFITENYDAVFSKSLGTVTLLNVKDALWYLEMIKVQFQDKPDVYSNFLDIMKDFKSQAIDTPGAIERVLTLFTVHMSLIRGFNVFLPHGYRIECPSDSQGTNSITVTTPTGTTTHPVLAPEFNNAIQYVNKIKTHFEDDPDKYKQFLEILQTYRERRIQDLYAQVTILFENADDLLEEFKQFISGTPASLPRRRFQEAVRKVMAMRAASIVLSQNGSPITPITPRQNSPVDGLIIPRTRTGSLATQGDLRALPPLERFRTIVRRVMAAKARPRNLPPVTRRSSRSSKYSRTGEAAFLDEVLAQLEDESLSSASHGQNLDDEPPVRQHKVRPQVTAAVAPSKATGNTDPKLGERERPEKVQLESKGEKPIKKERKPRENMQKTTVEETTSAAESSASRDTHSPSDHSAWVFRPILKPRMHEPIRPAPPFRTVPPTTFMPKWRGKDRGVAHQQTPPLEDTTNPTHRQPYIIFVTESRNTKTGPGEAYDDRYDPYGASYGRRPRSSQRGCCTIQ